MSSDSDDLQKIIRERILDKTIKAEPEDRSFEDVKNEVLSLLHKASGFKVDFPSSSRASSSTSDPTQNDEESEMEDRVSEFEIDFDESINKVVQQGMIDIQKRQEEKARETQQNFKFVADALALAQQQSSAAASSASSPTPESSQRKYKKYEYTILEELNARKMEERASDPNKKIDPHMRAIILYEFKTGHSAIEANRNINKAFGEGTITKFQVQQWFMRFRGGDSSVRDRKGGRKLLLRHCEEDLIDALIENPKITLQKLSEMFGVGVSTIFNQLRRLGIRKTKEGWK
ncbi:unnamed protein product [Bursaphelenchus xylophilus]|uniref:(pine wood nematode) hypothetical protein n=1 Tax=Bursaphelenchus xylophilus TaxID=6326 RepID=A0A1I7SVE6_BURXY|nr:unnamed protein product [Bursaphelenchus xylophilus]CAG9101335.1 unnamed protein product [Bursaphelenchus xylophilus]